MSSSASNDEVDSVEELRRPSQSAPTRLASFSVDVRGVGLNLLTRGSGGEESVDCPYSDSHLHGGLEKGNFLCRSDGNSTE